MGRKKLNRTKKEINELNRIYRMRSYWKNADPLNEADIVKLKYLYNTGGYTLSISYARKIGLKSMSKFYTIVKST